MAGEAEQAFCLDRNEAGHRLARKGNVGLAGPSLAKIASYPVNDLMFFRRQSAADRYSSRSKTTQGLAGVRQPIQFHQHIHGNELRSKLASCNGEAYPAGRPR
jgi:hypothetical protein